MIAQKIIVDRVTSAHSTHHGKQTVNVSLDNIELVKTETSFWISEPLLNVRMKNPRTILGPSIYVRLRDMAEALGVATVMEWDGKVEPRTDAAILTDLQAFLPLTT